MGVFSYTFPNIDRPFFSATPISFWVYLFTGRILANIFTAELIFFLFYMRKKNKQIKML